MTERKDDKALETDEAMDKLDEAGTVSETAIQAEDPPAEDVFVEDVIENNPIEEPAARPEDGPDFPDATVAPVAEKPRRGGGIGWLALLVAVIALAGSGYLAFMQRQSAADDEADAALQALSGQLDQTAERLRALEADVESAARTAAAAGESGDELETTLGNWQRRVNGAVDRLANLENTVASLQGISAGTRDRWLLAEAEYYMQIANAQLNLANNPTLAALALGMADERIVQTANPALTEVRATIADELAALELMETPDVEGITLTLASLARVVDSLPLRVIGEESASGDGEEIDPELSGVSRAWESVKGAMSGLVKVTPPDDDRSPLLTPETESLLRSNLSLQLQAARLALLRGEQAIFEQSLDDADAWLGLYFDTESAQVGSARTTIAEIRGTMFSGRAPDISESLRQLRQYNALSVEPQQ